VKGPDTSDEVVDLVAREYKLISKHPAVVRREIQGFIGNRLQAALFREALAIVGSGDATAPQLDEIVTGGFGREFARVGVFKGVPVESEGDDWSSVESLFPDLANNRELPRLLLDKVESGNLGVKTGRGFYEWTPESAERWRANMARRLQQMASGDR
jgi:3-hydroxybutyryl-CoA dehydrogenase